MNAHSVLSRVAMATGQCLWDWIKIKLGAGVPRCSGGGRRQPVRQRGSLMGFNSSRWHRGRPAVDTQKMLIS